MFLNVLIFFQDGDADIVIHCLENWMSFSLLAHLGAVEKYNKEVHEDQVYHAQRIDSICKYIAAFETAQTMYNSHWAQLLLGNYQKKRWWRYIIINWDAFVRSST